MKKLLVAFPIATGSMMICQPTNFFEVTDANQQLDEARY